MFILHNLPDSREAASVTPKHVWIIKHFTSEFGFAQISTQSISNLKSNLITFGHTLLLPKTRGDDVNFLR